MTLREILHAHIPTLTSESTLQDAIDKMDIYQFPALVLINDSRYPIGVLTEGDISRALKGGLDLRLAPETMASAAATMEPQIAHPNDGVSSSLDRMLEHDLTLLPIAEDGVLSGVVLRVDLMHALLMDMADQADAE